MHCRRCLSVRLPSMLLPSDLRPWGTPKSIRRLVADHASGCTVRVFERRLPFQKSLVGDPHPPQSHLVGNHFRWTAQRPECKMRHLPLPLFDWDLRSSSVNQPLVSLLMQVTCQVWWSGDGPRPCSTLVYSFLLFEERCACNLIVNPKFRFLKDILINSLFGYRKSGLVTRSL